MSILVSQLAKTGIDGNDSPTQTWSFPLPDIQSHAELHESHPMEIEKFPRKPDAEFALYTNIASSEEQLSPGKVQIGTFSE
jgi:hypothetical protein